MKLGNFVNNKLLPFLVALSGARRDSWRAEKTFIFLQSLVMIPVKRIRGLRRNSRFVEKQYDELSGLYIMDNYYKGRLRYSVVDGDVKEISSIDNAGMIRQEIKEILEQYKFKSILEVGVGELTSMENIYKNFGPDIDCYGIDLSLNRLHHGLAEYSKRHKSVPIVAKANAIKLPFPDDSFDLVYTRHTLEQMPLIYEQALDEIIRVSKKQIILFEPSFELGSLAQKVKMLNTDYVKGIPNYIDANDMVLVDEIHLMKNSANPLNHTACYKLHLKKPCISEHSPVQFVCPQSKSPLIKKDGYYFSKETSRAYPIVEGIPVLDYDYSVGISEPNS